MAGQPILVLSSQDVRDVSSSLPVFRLLESVHSALRSFSLSPKATQAPHRSTITSENYAALFMPSRIESIPMTCVKVVTIPKHGGQGGLPATTLVLNEQTGELDAVVNARSLTALRTAAASTLATKLCLGPEANPTHLVLFGAGAQCHAHAALLLLTFSQIRRCTVINRSHNHRLITLLGQLRAQFPEVDIAGIAGDPHLHGKSNTDIENAVKSASIICTATSSTTPLFPTDWVATGAHLNLVGSYTPQMHEVSPSLIERAKVVVVDSRAACAKEAGELIAANFPMEKAVELGELGNDMSLTIDKEENTVTLFKSVGVSVMDAGITDLVVRKAREVGRGTLIPYD